ncbi:unnamed protein product [Adineta ricciae]|uniref:C-type lectin domain-containing protein n=1 Tax=Adineta ricciae TaxID=249248 RepID=A0A814V786_ADIRI|nr:unnamed protein product [Adineta ricciae]CAF1187192.1 unnamed protein product [Adineta ricciae]
MFQQLVLPLLLLVQFSHQAPNTYGKSCNSDSGCDAHQKCLNSICRCNDRERRFWTGEACAICAREYSLTVDRCYKYFNDLKTWSAARAHCRAQYADLFTWRDNHDEQFIRPVMYSWITSSSSVWSSFFSTIYGITLKNSYIAWSGAIVTSLNPFTTKWMDPSGMKLELTSSEWCDPTRHAGYTLGKQPSRENKNGTNGTESEECVTYNFGPRVTNLLCLSDDYCSQKYPFICEMNDASMKLAVATHHGDNGDPSSGTNDGDGGTDEIDFEQPPPPPPSDSNYEKLNNDSPSALSAKSGILSNTNVIIFVIIGILLVVGAVAGYVIIKKKKATAGHGSGGQGGVSQGRPSFASSVESMVDE